MYRYARTVKAQLETGEHTVAYKHFQYTFLLFNCIERKRAKVGYKGNRVYDEHMMCLCDTDFRYGIIAPCDRYTMQETTTENSLQSATNYYNYNTET